MAGHFISKYEIADMLKISVRTLSYYCNTLYFHELSEMDYTVNQKKFTPRQVNFLKEKLDFQEIE